VDQIEEVAKVRQILGETRPQLVSGRGLVCVPDKVWSLMEFDEEESKQMMAGPPLTWRVKS